MDKVTTKTIPGIAPYVVGGAFVVLFVCLCAWQISRGFEKREQQRLFAQDSAHITWSSGLDTYPFQRIKVTGHFDTRQQFLLENIVLNGRRGYYVITPLVLDDAKPLVLVNRGWIQKPAAALSTDILDVEESRMTVRGRAGHLPRAGFKMGEGIAPGQRWPMVAVFPDYEEVSSALEREVHPLVLLLDPEERHGFTREWRPQEFRAGRHFGYALQWFLMAGVLAAILVRNYRRGGLEA